MANDLTGDFDVAAEFTTLAVNRVLAAMHRVERFPHSMSVRVDDNPPPGSQVVRPSVVGSVDEFGDPTVNPHHIGTPGDLLGQSSATDPRFWALDGVVNANMVGAFDPPVVPSKLQGRAQLQLAPPTIEVTGATGSNVTVKLPVMSRYFPDPHTPPVAEFVRGELQITAPVSQVASPDPKNVRMIDVDIKGDKVSVNFDRKWSSQPVSAEDLAGVNLLVRNALRTSFLPSSTQLPDSVNYMKFKTLLGPPNAIAVLLNMVQLDPVTGNPLPPGNPGNPASMNDVFLAAGDHFAFGLGIDYLRSLFINMLNKPIDPIPVSIPVYGSTTYTVSLTGVSVDLPEKILVTITGRATQTKRRFPDFNFTARLAFKLKPTGTTADLAIGEVIPSNFLFPLTDILVDTDSGLVNNFAKDRIVNGIRGARNKALSDLDAHGLDAYAKVNHMLSTDENLGQFLNSLLKPAAGDSSQQELKPVLAYTSVEYRPSGIVLHGGWMTVPDPPAVHVEFQQIPSTGGGGPGGVATGGLFGEGPDYSALRTWIPGGTIQQYEWSMQGQAQPFLIDINKFVLIHPPPQISGGTVSTGAVPGSIPTAVSSGVATTGAVSGFVPICLTVRGLRWSSSGPVVEQPVSATVCGYTRVSILEGIESTSGGALLMVALTQPGPGGLVEVAGHASARADGPGGGTPNRIVHFADEKTAGHLEFLTQALRQSKREDAATAVLALLTPDQLAKARYTESVIYAEEQGGAWARAFGVKTTRRPLTLIVGPKGNIVWQQEGDLDSEKLAAALGKNLVSGGPVSPRMLGLSLRIGRPAPNFVFEFAPGRGLTLRKLVGRPVVLVFWKSSSKPSIETVRDLQKPTGKAGGQGPVVLAINDGEVLELAKKVAAENGLSATIVADPQRSISLAYGVTLWPTIVFIDAFGLVRKIRYGRFAGENVESPSPGKAAASR